MLVSYDALLRVAYSRRNFAVVLSCTGSPFGIFRKVMLNYSNYGCHINEKISIHNGSCHLQQYAEWRKSYLELHI